MFPSSSRLALAGLLAVAVLSAVAQDPARDPEDYRRFFKRPETPMQFWNALEFELDVGRPDLAGKLLRGLMAKKPTEADILAIADKNGTLAVLRLRNIRTWSSEKKEQDQTVKDVEELIKRVSEATKKRAGDPARIRELIRQLRASPEERTYALRELYKSGVPAVPIMLDSLLRASDAEERLSILEALKRMGSESIGPMLAVLDSDSTASKLDILNILRDHHARYSRQIVPFLWYPSVSPTQPEEVRRRARALLATFLEVPATRLTPAKFALTREAERYYNHEVTFGDPRAVVIWRWDGKGVVQGWPSAPTVSATQAEEYYGLRFARRALNLDPTYRPAQLVLLGLAVDKAVDRGGQAVPLSRSAPAVADMLARSSPTLVIELLDRALKENRTGIVLSTIRALGERAETRGKRPLSQGDAALSRALYYPDPRVQAAAVIALLRIPGPPAPRTAARMVEIAAGFLAPLIAMNPGPKVLVAVGDPEWRVKVARSVRETGVGAVSVGTGREAMQKLRASGEIQAILLDSTLPMPGLSHLLAQLRADADVGRIPILLAAVPESRASRFIAQRFREVQARIDQLREDTADYTASVARIDEEENQERTETEEDFRRSRLSEDDKLAARRNIDAKYLRRRKELSKIYPTATLLLAKMPQLEAERDGLIRRYDLESQEREAALNRYTSKMPGVQVVAASLLTDAATLKGSLRTQIRNAGVALTPAEQTQFAEVAIGILAGLASGDPPGYDVKPVADRILDALRAGKLSPDGQISAISMAGRFPGPRPQVDLAYVLLDGARPLPVRTAAVTGMVQNIQRYGVLLTERQLEPIVALARQEKLDPGLRDNLASLLGGLRPGPRMTGDLLRSYRPQPAGAIPPPPK